MQHAGACQTGYASFHCDTMLTSGLGRLYI